MGGGQAHLRNLSAWGLCNIYKEELCVKQELLVTFVDTVTMYTHLLLIAKDWNINWCLTKTNIWNKGGNYVFW